MAPSFDIIALFAVFILFIVCVVFFRRAKYPYFPRGTLLTKAELHLYNALRRATPSNHMIMMKVRLNDIINCSDRDWARGFGPKISSKHIDFVLINAQSTEITLCIELDDRSHERGDRKRRDAFVNNALNAADVPLLRVPTSRHYDTNKLKKEISELVVNS